MSKELFDVKFTGKNDNRKFQMVRNLWTAVSDNKNRYSRVQFVSMRSHKDSVSFGLKYITSDGKRSGMVRISEALPFEIGVMTTPAVIQTLKVFDSYR